MAIPACGRLFGAEFRKSLFLLSKPASGGGTLLVMNQFVIYKQVNLGDFSVKMNTYLVNDDVLVMVNVLDDV